jgi:HEAT repeat protein
MEGLLNYIDDGSPDIRKAVFAILPTVIGSLQKEPSPAVIGKLRRLISDEAEDKAMRANVLNGLASFIRKQLIAGRRPTILTPVLHETNKWIQTSTDKDMLNAAVEAAGKMGQTESITPLIDALTGLQGDEAAPVREKICDALGMFFEVLRKGNRADVARIAEALLTVFSNQNETAAIRAQAVYALSSLYYKEHDKTIAYLNLADYWNPNPATPRDPKLYYDANLEQQVRMTLKIFTDSIDFGNNYTGWMDWYRKNEALLKSRQN